MILYDAQIYFYILQERVERKRKTQYQAAVIGGGRAAVVTAVDHSTLTMLLNMHTYFTIYSKHMVKAHTFRTFKMMLK